MAYYDVTGSADLDQEIARSAFADMLLDNERNEMYKKGLISKIQEKHQKGESANVIDIGTGSGLLSLIAAEAGADHVTAIEVFSPMAEIANKIFRKSQYANKINLIKARSTDLNNLEPKGNIIVAEVFDTELIGEGALRTFKEACKSLTLKDFRVVPSKARIWVLPVQSPELQKFNKFDSKFLKMPFGNCAGTSAVFDIQLSEFKDFESLIDPINVFSFNFEDADSIVYDENVIHEFVVKSKVAKTFDALLMWWDLDMDGNNQYYIDMAPQWFNANNKWRDHWMQAVYFLEKPLNVALGDKIFIKSFHDEFTFWFHATNVENAFINMILEKSICTCMMHVICPRSAIYRMNSLEETNFLPALIKECQYKSVISINEGSLIGLYAAISAKSVAIIDSNPYFRHILMSIIKSNAFSHVKIFSNLKELNKNLNIDFGIFEPFYLSSILPHENLRIWNDYRYLTKLFPNIKSCIKTMYLKCVTVKFENLWKIVAPINNVLGFDLSPFNEVYQTARQSADDNLEAHSLWEYPSTVMGSIKDLIKIDFTMETLEEFNVTNVICNFKRDTNALVFWTEFEYVNGFSISYGIKKNGEWNKGQRQGVYFFEDKLKKNKKIKQIGVQIKIHPSDFFCDLKFSF